ncbi:MAG TPA: hypothetical protein VFU05_20720 [Cyclobacteriaceae bacterium]|nr:hypothetical protein [Cyclobacteriaceae bacterium]
MGKKKKTKAVIMCNSLEVKTKYIYFRSGELGSPDPGCGNLPRKELKKKVTWEIDGKCEDGKDLWKITYK